LAFKISIQRILIQIGPARQVDSKRKRLLGRCIERSRMFERTFLGIHKVD
jgi:hypothetical protein